VSVRATCTPKTRNAMKLRRQLKLGAATAETWGKTSHRSPQRACALANRLTFELGQSAQDRHMSRRCAVRCLYLHLDPAPELLFATYFCKTAMRAMLITQHYVLFDRS
jgi:hypothetical protein